MPNETYLNTGKLQTFLKSRKQHNLIEMHLPVVSKQAENKQRERERELNYEHGAGNQRRTYLDVSQVVIATRLGSTGIIA